MSSSTVVPQPRVGFDFKPLVEALSLPINIAVKTAKKAPSVFYNNAKAIGKTAILDAPKAILDSSTHALAKTRHFAAESIKPLAEFFNASNAAPKTFPITPENVLANQEQGKKINALFTNQMAALKTLSETQALDMFDSLKQYQQTLESGGPATLQEHLEAYGKLETIARLLDERLPLSAAPITHHVHHSTAPSWLALLLDGTYEPSHIEELATLIQTAANQGLAPIQDEFNEIAQEITEKPLEVLAKESTFKNIDSSIAYVIADVAASFLGILSVVRGYQEFKEAGHHLHSLKAERKQLKTDKEHINTLHSMLGENIPNGLMFQKLLNLSKLDRNKRGIHATKIDRWIGLSAVGAGASSALKGISDLGMKTGLAIKSLASGHGLFGGAIVATKGTAAGLAATATGVAGTLALGPLAGLFAVGLGLGFHRKTQIKLSQLNRQAKQYIEKTHGDGTIQLSVLSIHRPSIGLDNPEERNAYNNFKTFMSNGAKERIRFFRHFSKWNKAFLVGAGLYTASAGAKAAIVGASLLGATAAASNPVGWGVLTGVGIAGAIVVGLATLGFIKGHVRQTRYNQHTAGDHPLVDRHFLVNAQNFERKGTDEQAHFHDGLKLAAENLEFLEHRQTSLKTLLETAATATDSLAPHSDKLNVFQRMRGNTLGKTKFNAYLNKEGGLKTILDKFVTNDIEKHIQHITNKLAFRQKTHEENTLSDEQLALIAQQPNAQDALDSYESHLTRLASKASMDTHRLLQLRALKEQLNQLRGEDSNSTSPENQAKIKTLLLQHWGVQTTDKKGKALDVDKLFAKQMVRTLNKEVDMAKGVLFEAQLEASHMNSLPKTNEDSTSLKSPVEEPSTHSSSSDGEIRTATPSPRSPTNA